jgi:hypothetical protein
VKCPVGYAEGVTDSKMTREKNIENSLSKKEDRKLNILGLIIYEE